MSGYEATRKIARRALPQAWHDKGLGGVGDCLRGVEDPEI